MLQELRCRQLLAVAQFYDFGNVLHYINHFHLLVKLQAVLRVVTEADRLANVQRTAVCLLQPHQYLDEGRLARTVIPYDTHLFVTGEDVGEIIQNLQVTKGFVQMVCFEYLAAYVRSLDIQFDVVVVETLLSHLLQLVKGILPIACLVPAGLRHAAHPFQLCAVEVIGTFYLHSLGLDTLLALLQIITVIAFILINLPVVYLYDFGAYPVEEITVVRHHQQAEVVPAEIFLQPLRHIEVEVVGRLVQYQQIGFSDKGIGKCHTLQLPAGQMFYVLTEITYFKLRQNLFRLLLVLPSFFMVHTHQNFVQAGMPLRFHATFIFLD